MISPDPRLPNTGTPDYQNRLAFRLNELLRQIIGEVNNLSGSDWNGFHPVMGGHHVWVDSSNRLRIKASKPTSDTDGTIVGTQT